jgi:hydrogenase expression/formation protein HypC
MCLALPMRVLSIDGDLATIAAEGLEQSASLALVPEAGVGDWVLVHAGYAISVLTEREARETLDLLAELGEPDGSDPLVEHED